MEQLHVAPDLELASRRLGDLVPREARLIVLAIGKPDGKMIFNPPVEMQLFARDAPVVIWAEQPSLPSMESLLTKPR